MPAFARKRCPSPPSPRTPAKAKSCWSQATVDGGDQKVAPSSAAPTVSDLVRVRWASALGPDPDESGGFEFCQYSLPYADDETGEQVPDTYNLLLNPPTNPAVFYWLEW